MNVNDGKFVDAIQITCADGTIMKQGGQGGYIGNPLRTGAGFKKIRTKQGEWINEMSVYPIETNMYPGRYGGRTTFWDTSMIGK